MTVLNAGQGREGCPMKLYFMWEWLPAAAAAAALAEPDPATVAAFFYFILPL